MIKLFFGITIVTLGLWASGCTEAVLNSSGGRADFRSAGQFSTGAYLAFTPASFNIPIGSVITVEALVRPQVFGLVRYVAMIKSAVPIFNLTFNAANQISLSAINSASCTSTAVVFSTVRAFSVEENLYIVVVMARGGFPQIYVNGNLEPATGGNVFYNGAPCTLGAVQMVLGADNTFVNAFTGVIDEFRFTVSSGLKYATVPSSLDNPLTFDSDTIFLFHFDEALGAGSSLNTANTPTTIGFFGVSLVRSPF